MKKYRNKNLSNFDSYRDKYYPTIRPISSIQRINGENNDSNEKSLRVLMREQLEKDMKYMKERIENYKEECNDTR